MGGACLTCGLVCVENMHTDHAIKNKVIRPAEKGFPLYLGSCILVCVCVGGGASQQA